MGLFGFLFSLEYSCRGFLTKWFLIDIRFWNNWAHCQIPGSKIEYLSHLIAGGSCTWSLQVHFYPGLSFMIWHKAYCSLCFKRNCLYNSLNSPTWSSKSWFSFHLQWTIKNQGLGAEMAYGSMCTLLNLYVQLCGYQFLKKSMYESTLCLVEGLFSNLLNVILFSSIYLSIHPSVRPSVGRSVCPSVHPSIHPPTHPSIQCILPSYYPSVTLCFQRI